MEKLKTRYRVEGMDCGTCAAKIETAARRVRGVADVSVSLAAHSMVVEHDTQTDLAGLVKQVTGLGYGVFPTAPQPPHLTAADGSVSPAQKLDGASVKASWWRSPKGRLMLASGVGLALAFLISKLLPAAGAWPFTAAMLIGLLPIGRRAVGAALAGTPFSIEMLMTIAAVGAILIGASEEGATVLFLFLIGELLEGVAAGKARASIEALAKLVPATAFIEHDDKVREVAAGDLTVGDIILVRPGDRIAADGVIASGAGEINEAPVTGESTPVRKAPGALVFAGTVNADAVLRVRVTASASDNTIARIVKLVEEAQGSKAPTERFIDRFSRYYTPGVVIFAALVAVVPPLIFGGGWHDWIYKGLAILLIGCPCALVISTPAAIAASLSAGGRRGLLLKGGAVLEGLGKITLAAFDKTGTLTEGKPQVTDVAGFGASELEVLRYAAALESGSSHPLASAILAKAAAEGVVVPRAEHASAVGGKGVTGIVEGAHIFLGSAEAVAEQTTLPPGPSALVMALNDQGKTVSIVVRDDAIVGLIAMRDEPRADACTSSEVLRQPGCGFSGGLASSGFDI